MATPRKPKSKTPIKLPPAPPPPAERFDRPKGGPAAYRNFSEEVDRWKGQWKSVGAPGDISIDLDEWGGMPEIMPDVPDPERESQLTSKELDRLREILVEAASRRKDALKLYTPLPEQVAFHSCRSALRLIIGGNRGGKTLGAAAEVAAAITNQDPYGKYPDRGRAIFVGKDLIHCSKVMYRKLFKPGAFRIIRDQVTGEWRAWNPATDADREYLAEDAPPLVPSRYLSKDAISWENKREEIPRSIRLPTAWECTMFSGEGEPPQGWDVDLIWLDEEIPHPRWFSEMIPRLVDRGGRLIWSATPQAGTHHLYELSERADDEADDPDARCRKFFVNIFSNTYISEKKRNDFIADLGDDEDEIRVRVHGDFALAGMRIYPDFAPKGAHGCDPFIVPEEWCRVVSVDPGRQRGACLIGAISPPHQPEFGGQVVIYDELYIKNCNAKLFAKRLKEKLGQQNVHYWIIDHHGGRSTQIGSGKTVESEYREAMLAEKLDSNGFKGFIWGNDDLDGGIEAVRTSLHIHGGRCRLKVMREKTPWLIWEMSRYCNKKITAHNIVTDKPEKRHDHLCDALRYILSHPLRYVKPPLGKQGKERAWTAKYLAKKKAKERESSQWGGGIGLG
jgi:hypothetical protein